MKNIISLILIAVSVALGFFYIWPEYGKISDLRAQNESYTLAIAQTKQVKNQSDNLAGQYNSISDSDKASLQTMIPNHFDLINMISNLNAIALRYGMTIKQVSDVDQSSSPDASRGNIIAPSSDAPYQTITLSFTTSGTYQNFVGFLRALEQNRELIDVTKLTVNGTTGQSGTAPQAEKLNFQVTAHTYAVSAN